MLIYDKLVGDRVFWVDFPQDGSLHYRVLGSPAILRVSKQVRDEAQRAVKVRTLRVNKFKLSNAKLLLRIPSIVSRWAPTIRNLLIGYRQFEFDALLGRGDGIRPDRLLTGLKHVLVHLPNLVTVTITCDDLPFQRDQELENQASKFSQDLLTSLPHFNRIQLQMRRKKTWAALSAAEEAKIKLSKVQPYLQPTVSANSQDSVRYVELCHQLSVLISHF